jgi:hypothetical protein
MEEEPWAFAMAMDSIAGNSKAKQTQRINNSVVTLQHVEQLTA